MERSVVFGMSNIIYTPDKLKNSLLTFLQFKQYKKLCGKSSFEDFLRKLCILYNYFYKVKNISAFIFAPFVDRVGILEAQQIIRSLDTVDINWRRKAPEI